VAKRGQLQKYISSQRKTVPKTCYFSSPDMTAPKMCHFRSQGRTTSIFYQLRADWTKSQFLQRSEEDYYKTKSKLQHNFRLIFEGISEQVCWKVAVLVTKSTPVACCTTPSGLMNIRAGVGG
jgi:hypothetical protein